MGRLCLSALLDPVIHRAQSRAQGTDHHLLQQVKNIEVTGKDLQAHAQTLEDEKKPNKKSHPNCWLIRASNLQVWGKGVSLSIRVTPKSNQGTGFSLRSLMSKGFCQE